MKTDLTLKKCLIMLVFMHIASPILVSAGEAGTALKADVLRVNPFADAKSVGNLNKNDAVDILGKKGAWLQVKTAKNTGWVRLLSVKRGGVSTGNQAKGLADIASGRAGTGKIVSTTGIRGLSAEELKTAQFNETEMKKLESNAVSANNGQKFATAGGLTASKIPYFAGAQ